VRGDGYEKQRIGVTQGHDEGMVMMHGTIGDMDTRGWGTRRPNQVTCDGHLNLDS
jgi:hypothetical protein